jgi:hypothetical protein
MHGTHLQRGLTKRPVKELEILLHTNMEHPFAATTSSQEDSPGKNVTHGSEDWKSKTSSSYLDPERAQQDPEASGYGLNIPQEATPDEDFDTWHFLANAGTVSGNLTSDDIYPLLTELPATSSWSPGIHMQNDVYIDSLPADPIPEPWNATSNIPGHNPPQILNDLAGLLPGGFPDYCHAHATVQDNNNGSDISSLSSSYLYNIPEPQGPFVGHSLPTPVPWSRPNTLEEDRFDTTLWIQGSILPDQLEINSVSEQAVSGMHFALALGLVEN